MIPEISKAMQKAVEAYHKYLENCYIESSMFPIEIKVFGLAHVDDYTHAGQAPVEEYVYRECDYRLDKK